jgi:putative NIF3 family GTP cyclohydrolase 1 type 2
MKLQQLLNRLNDIAPLAIAEEWDNVGLLVGDPAEEIRKVMTCLTITAATVAEAIAQRADCIVVHHPIPFKPVSLPKLLFIRHTQLGTMPWKGSTSSWQMHCNWRM